MATALKLGYSDAVDNRIMVNSDAGRRRPRHLFVTTPVLGYGIQDSLFLTCPFIGQSDGFDGLQL
ncbi:hypothetical protein SNOG_13747 [Parastagonospora nodorum SN15]|uniref:Uncharacterized protein n=1 Tax=Phaeosphaeria nodorum (strain SN15 / ATCC MYA-4574 / FGSC 10173) TaxID=321614 RepID=Q0U3B7_PHANO|nr:hypothetical protein SNOG_13747 [Parastagonospora nodorum SN15]EAT78771.1 hypothetical protein SNOG_13747 [Parastagonospora nodorum SN15]